MEAAQVDGVGAGDCAEAGGLAGARLLDPGQGACVVEAEPHLAVELDGPAEPRDAADHGGVVADRHRVRHLGDVLVIEPADGDARVAFALYPGGLVRPQAYEWIGHALAPHGVTTLIPEMPFDLAVLGSDRATQVAGELAPGLDVVVGGHSLGGVMAATCAAKHPGDVDGLVLLAAYPSDGDDLTAAAIPTLSLMAEHDGLADEADVRGGLDRLPGDARLAVVDGAVHSFFGRYGPQDGDGVPTVSRATAEAQITAELVAFFDAVD